MNDSQMSAKTDTRFMNLEYRNISLLGKMYFYLRTMTWYEKISSPCRPNSRDKDDVERFLTDGVIKEDDLIIFERRKKYFVLIKDDTTLNALRICQ